MSKFSRKPGVVVEPKEPEAPLIEQVVQVSENDTREVTEANIQITLKSVPKMKVFMAACGLLLHNELKRQFETGTVKQFGRLNLEGVEIVPNIMAEIPDTPAVRKALEDGWIVYVGR